VYTDTARTFSIPDPAPYDAVVTTVVNGDDNVSNVDDVVSPWFNQNTFALVSKKLNVEYTVETKDERDVPNFRNIREVSYLRRFFRSDTTRGNGWICPLDPDVIYESPLWTESKHLSHPEIQINTLLASAFEASLHGRTFYEKFCSVYHEQIVDLMVDGNTHYKEVIFPSYFHQLSAYDQRAEDADATYRLL